MTELTAKTNDLSFRDLKTLVANIESFLIKHPDAPFNRELVLQLLIEMKSKKLELETKAEEIENEDERRRQIMEEQHGMQNESIWLQRASVILQIVLIFKKIFI